VPPCDRPKTIRPVSGRARQAGYLVGAISGAGTTVATADFQFINHAFNSNYGFSNDPLGNSNIVVVAHHSLQANDPVFHGHSDMSVK